MTENGSLAIVPVDEAVETWRRHHDAVRLPGAHAGRGAALVKRRCPALNRRAVGRAGQCAAAGVPRFRVQVGNALAADDRCDEIGQRPEAPGGTAKQGQDLLFQPTQPAALECTTLESSTTSRPSSVPPLHTTACSICHRSAWP